MKRVLAAILLSCTWGLLAPYNARAEGCGEKLSGCTVDNIGATVGMSRAAVLGLLKSPGDDGSPMFVVAADKPRYEYDTTTECTDARPGEQGSHSGCASATVACRVTVSGPGPLTKIWRRTVAPGKPATDWDLIGSTCWTDVAPGARPSVSMEMVENAFHLTPWATPSISTQPKGDVTLVGLDTYYKVNWSEQGFQPGEVDTIAPAQMNGYQVDIRVKLDHFTYKFGDGQTFGPTTYEGGVYPTGTITHQYVKGGAYPSSVDTTFGGEFRINGSDWAPIPDTVTVPGPATVVTAKTARAQLVAH